MKLKSILIMTMVTLVMTNCNQDEYQEEILQSGITRLVADVEGNSRSVMSDNGAFSWTEGDLISVWNTNNNFTTYKCTSGNNFDSENPIIPSKFAVYPAGNHRVSGNNISVDLPSSYGSNDVEYVKNTNAIMLASVQSGNNNLYFKHLGGLMRFNIKDVPEGANQFVFTAHDKGITGVFQVSNNQIVASTKNNSNNTVTIKFKSSNYARDMMTFYIPLPTGTYTGYKVEIKSDNTTLLTYNASNAKNTVNRRTLLLMPTLTCTNGTLDKGNNVVSLEKTSQEMNISGTESITLETPPNSDQNTALSLNYTPDENATLTIKDEVNACPANSKATVQVKVAGNETVNEVQVEAPTLTVELLSQNGSVTYKKVTAKTAVQTLKIKSGVTVEKLYLNGGNIIIEQGATVKNIYNATGYSDKTYIVKKGTITNTPSLNNVKIVTDENQITQIYSLRVLTFEDDDAKFEPYTLDYVDYWAGREISTWSDLIDDPQYGGPLTYGDYQNTMYTWWDENNTELTHTFPDNYAYCFWGGGHAISNYWGAGYTDEDRDKHIAKYYGEDYVTDNAGNDQMLGWFNLQMMTPVKAHSGNNFAVHYGYKDFFSYVENLPELIFADDELHVIDHMYVTNTNYTLNQLFLGVKSEAGNTFGGSWKGLTDSAWLKIVAQGFKDIDADGNATPDSEVEFYLVKGTYVVTDWQKWDLSGLGKVAKVRFNFKYSSEMGGKYGFTIPGYFAYDDVAVRFE